MSEADFSKIFFPHHTRQLERVEKNHIKFAHYTNADTAFRIIKNQEIWLRNIAVMNDYREFEHGKDCLIKLIEESTEGQSLKDVFDKIDPNIFKVVYSKFKEWAPYIKDDFYISCFSEYESEDEDIGKLSMWRAYAGSAGVAIIFKQDLFSELVNQDLDFSSVAYLKPEKLKEEIVHLTKSISSNIDDVKALPIGDLQFFLFNIFRFSALCNKHKGFEEEKEWRLIATASIHTSNDLVTQEIETIKGTPQNVVKIRLPKNKSNHFQFKDMIDKIIIGPCLYPWIIRKSFLTILSEIGIEKPEEMIRVSDIPLRANQN